MLYLSALAAPLLLIGASSSAPVAKTGRWTLPDQSNCPKPVTLSDKAVFKRLGDLPPANAYQAVLRADHRGCATAIPVHHHIGRPR